MSWKKTIGLTGMLVVAGAKVSAHHAVSMVYFFEQSISVSGVVEEFRFHNPHCVIFLTQTNDAGESVRWTIEWAGASALRRQGITKQTIKPGDVVTVTGLPARDGSAAMAFRVLEFADGRPVIRLPDRSGENETNSQE